VKKLVRKPTAEQSGPAHGMARRLISNPITIICGLIAVALLMIFAYFAYYRTHQKAVWVENVTVMISQTYPVTDDLSITLTDVKERPDPPGFVVMATVSHKDLADMKIRNASIGSIVTYPKEHGYSIELLKADSASAQFSITKNP
jgi:hypothetical protein